MVSVVRVGRRSAQPVHVEVIGSPARARAWLAGADWFSVGRQPVVLVAPRDTLLLHHHVARAELLAAHGSVVYVLLDSRRGPGLRPWHAVDWVEGPDGLLRGHPRRGGRRSGRPIRRVGVSSTPTPAPVAPVPASPSPRSAPARSRPPSRPPKARPRRKAVATRLAGTGPAVGTYVEQHRVTHATGPSCADIARALAWPGDDLDHDRALRALANVDWINIDATCEVTVGPRWLEHGPLVTSRHPAIPPAEGDPVSRTARVGGRAALMRAAEVDLS